MARVRLGSLADFEVMDSWMEFTPSHKLRTDVEEVRICIGIIKIPLQLYKVQAFFFPLHHLEEHIVHCLKVWFKYWIQS